MTACDRARDATAELVLGILDGEERALVVDHLAECAACRADVARLTEAIDGLNLLAPRRAPSAGFQSRILAAIDAAPTVPVAAAPVRPALFARIATAAALVFLSVGAAAIAISTNDSVARASSAPMIGVSGQQVGDAYLISTTPPTVIIAVTYSGRVDYQPMLQGVDQRGNVRPIAPLSWREGQWRWRGPIEPADTELVAFRVIGGRGEIVCEGHID